MFAADSAIDNQQDNSINRFQPVTSHKSPVTDFMPTLTIDNQQITVPPGTNVLEAAKALGLVIPHFCYHEALGAVGACRLCAMTFLDGPVKGLQMSCMVEAKDGMVVSTLDEKAQELRKHVIEWLMLHHPHDCPVCDEGGECQLQDMTVAGGHSIRRYRGKKRTYVNQNLGPFVEHEMNRCIQCYRCVRTYQDYCGGSDFGVLGTNQRVYFGRFRDGRLESPFAGNLVDVCPTGVFTDKTFRFKSRYWDLEEAPSVCPHCSLGCAVIPGSRYRELQRVRGGVNRQTNGFFICDRGRFGYGHANHPERPRYPKMDGRESAWPATLAAARERLAKLAGQHGGGSVAFLGSPRASLEANALLKRWAADLGSDQIAFEAHPQRDRAARATAAGLGEHVRSLEEVRHSDFVLLIGADPLAEGPQLALAVRQALRAGGQAAVLDPRPVELPCEAAHLPLAPERLPAALAALASGDFAAFDRQESIFLEGVRARLQGAQRPILAGGADLLGPEGVEVLLRTVRDLSTPERPGGAALLLAGPNSFGGALLAGDGPDFDALLDGILAGDVRALVCLEADPFRDHPDPARVRTALSRLKLLIVLDCVPSEAAQRADIFLPTSVPAEGAGTFVNHEGRMLPFAAAFAPGISIRETGGGNHPPRSFTGGTPGDQPHPAWAILTELREASPSLATIHREIEARDPRFVGLAGLAPGGEGQRVVGSGLPAGAPAPLPPHCEPGGTLHLLPVETFFGSELLSSLSPPLAAVAAAPHVLLHTDDAAGLGLADGEDARLTTALGHFSVTVRTSDRMARGVAILPRLRGTPVEVFVPGAGHLDCLLEKEGAA
jgi:NADH-quinone oxidoreductase subunit G